MRPSASCRRPSTRQKSSARGPLATSQVLMFSSLDQLLGWSAQAGFSRDRVAVLSWEKLEGVRRGPVQAGARESKPAPNQRKRREEGESLEPTMGKACRASGAGPRAGGVIVSGGGHFDPWLG